MESPNNPVSLPNVVVGSYWGGVPFFGSFRGSGFLFPLILVMQA